MSRSKRKLESKSNPKPQFEDTETEIVENVDLKDESEEEDDDNDDSDSSVYSGLSEEDEDSSEDEDEEDGEAEESEAEEKEEIKEKSVENPEISNVRQQGNNRTKKKTSKATQPSIEKEASTTTTEQEEEGKSKNNDEDEYAYDSSDEEDIRNTIGNIPVNWYDDYEHIGYNLDGRQIRKPKRGDELDHFLRRMEDGNAGITVQDPMTGQDVVLSEEQVQAIRRLRQGKVPDGKYNLYEDLVPWFSSEVMQVPIRDLPESKKSFLPSISEKRKVGRMVHSIKMGWMKTKAQRDQEAKEDPTKRYYMLWATDDQAEEIRRINDLIPAPKMKLPGHAESYNPPPEYLFTDKEKEQWEEHAEEPYKRKLPFIPQKYDSLRKVPAYKNFINERFERCLDLYLAPRARKMRLTIQPEDLLPQLPKPKDLQPFPTACVLTFKGHMNMIRTISIDPSGQFIASGSDDGTVKVWEIQTGYCMKTFTFSKVAIRSVMWCPNKALSLLAIALESMVVLVNANVGDKVVVNQTNDLLAEPPDFGSFIPPERVNSAVTWSKPEKADKLPKEVLIVLKFFKPVKQVTWHGKGDYFATVLVDAANRSVLVHQLSKWKSQLPLGKTKGLVQCVLFHPIRPYFFVATQRHVRVYNLAKQELAKKLTTGAKWISSLAIHPKGDNVLLGTYDKRVQWFDLDLSTMPYQVLRYHASAVRQVAYHKRYPLFASGADDTSIIVSHGMVYNDLLQNPLIVPVKLLRGHTKYDDFGIMDVTWHPTQPWLFSAGADGYIKLWA